MELTTACIKSAYVPTRGGYCHCQNPWDKTKKIYHHRLAYLLANNLQPKDIEGLDIRHKCDNPACINPEHLIVGTHQDNMNDMVARGRSNTARGSSNGNSVLTEELVKLIRKEYRTATLKEVGAKYKIHYSTVSLIIKGKLWNHVK